MTKTVIVNIFINWVQGSFLVANNLKLHQYKRIVLDVCTFLFQTISVKQESMSLKHENVGKSKWSSWSFINNIKRSGVRQGTPQLQCWAKCRDLRNDQFLHHQAISVDSSYGSISSANSLLKLAARSHQVRCVPLHIRWTDRHQRRLFQLEEDSFSKTNQGSKTLTLCHNLAMKNHFKERIILVFTSFNIYHIWNSMDSLNGHCYFISLTGYW